MTTGEVIALIKAFGGGSGGGGSSGGGVLVVHQTGEFGSYTLDKTWQQIHDALLSGGAVLAFTDQAVSVISSTDYYDDFYYVTISGGMTNGYKTADADGYPSEGDQK